MISTCLAILVFIFCLLHLAFPARAAIYGTNLVPVAAYSSGVITGAVYQPSQTHSINSQTFSIYHSATNAAFPSTNYFETSFDGGQTWTVTAVYVTGTNTQNELWTPNTTSLVATNRLRIVTTTNQTIYVQANWIQ